MSRLIVTPMLVEADTTFGTGIPSWDPDDQGMASKGSQEVVITLVWLRRKGVHPLHSLVKNQFLMTLDTFL